MRRTTDILIVGGGVIGCAIAYYLRLAGRDVLVLDQGEIAAQASSAAAGLLAPLGPLTGSGPFADLLLASFALFPALVPELEEASGLHLAYEQTGALRVVRNPKRIASLKKRLATWQTLGLHLHWLSGDEARQQEPSLAPDICAAVYAPQEAQIKASHIVQAFALAAERRGARFASQCEVVGVERHNNKVTGVQLAQGERIACGHLVVAAGAWAAHCGTWLDTSIPVSPLCGELCFVARPVHTLRHIVFGEGAYLVPRGEQILIGATKYEAGFTTDVTPEGIAWLNAIASRLMPRLAHSDIQSMRAGLRPRTPDMRPILGPVAPWENVTLATGHNSVGIILSPLTGQAIAAYINTGRVPEIIQPFSLARFSI